MKQLHDGSLARELDPAPLLRRSAHSYYAEVKARNHDEQSNIIDRLIGLAFETLDARHLDLRVVESPSGACCAA